MIKKYRVLFCVVLSALLLTDVAAQQAKIDSFILKQMNNLSIKGLSIGIVKNGQVLLTKGYGFADIELNVKATDKTAYKIGSISKQFVALGIMRLVQEKKLRVEDSVSKFFKNAPPGWKDITVRHLLNHTSGLPAEPPGFDPLKKLPDSFYIIKSFSDTLAYATGSKYAYSNFAYFVLADIIRIVSHESFENYMQKNIIDELGLKNTRATNPFEIIPNRASGYQMDENHAVRNAPVMMALRPSGAFLSTAADMVQYELAIQQTKLLSASGWNRLFNDTINTQLSMDGAPIYYAYGWMNNKMGGRQLIHHAGSMPGFGAVYFRLPKQKTAIIILTNSDYADLYQIAFGIEEIVR